MIDRQEILEFAGEVGLDPNVVEKDYVLGWMLAGISQNPRTRDSWIFKGGTCLKKCYFETYRFSEDLDFTLLDGSHLDEAFLRAAFTEIAQWVHQREEAAMWDSLWVNVRVATDPGIPRRGARPHPFGLRFPDAGVNDAWTVSTMCAHTGASIDRCIY